MATCITCGGELRPRFIDGELRAFCLSCEEKKGSEIDNKYMCDVCDFVVGEELDLLLHKNEVHPDTFLMGERDEKLFDIALDSKFPEEIRTTAVKRIDSKDMLETLAKVTDIFLIEDDKEEKISNTSIRKVAVECMIDMNVLIKMARQEKVRSVCKSLVEKINDEDKLLDLVFNSENPVTRQYAMEKIESDKIIREVIHKHSDSLILEIALEKIKANLLHETDQKVLGRYVIFGKNADIRDSIIVQITDEECCKEIVIKCKNDKYRHLAMEKITNEGPAREIILGVDDIDLIRKSIALISDPRSIIDQRILQWYAILSDDWDLQEYVIEVINNNYILQWIAIESEDERVIKKVIDKITDSKVLDNILNSRQIDDFTAQYITEKYL